MDNSARNDHENGFYKGLFYGTVLALGLVWFLGTKEGQKLKEELLEKGQDFFEKPIEEDDPDELLEAPTKL